ncbi:MAG: sugar ABC transporter permease [Phycisphaerae bacterium]
MPNAHKEITWRGQLEGMAFAAPYLIGLAVFVVIPLVLSLYLSGTEYPMLTAPMWIGLDNYRALLHDPIFHQALRNTLFYAAGSVPLTLAASVGLALLLNQKVPGRAIFRTIIFLPSLVPAVAGAMLWLWVLNGQDGLLNVLLRAGYRLVTFGGAGGGAGGGPKLPSYLTHESWVLPIFILLTLYSVGNAVIIFLAGLQDIPTELYESAELDGASGWRRLIHITLPMLSPVIFFNLIMGIIGSWQVFTLPQIMVGPNVNRAGYFYSMYIFDSAFMQQRMGYASAMAWIQFLIVLSLTLLVMWTSKRWVHYR